MSAVTVLAIETSTPRGSIALVSSDEAILFSEFFESDRSHNSLLFDPLERALVSGHEFDAILVGIGPGSYTGVRIGISAAIGVSLARGVKIAGVSSLCALKDAPASGSYQVVGDARRGTFFHIEVHRWRASPTPVICSGEELGALVKGNSLPVLTCDASPLPVDAKVSFPDAARLAIAGHYHPLDFASQVEPIYLRAPYVTTPKPKGRPAD